MPAVQSNDVTIEYEQQGSGPDLLLVMGLGGQLTDWPQGFVDLLADRFTVTLFDNRDSGLSTEIDAPAPRRNDFLRSQVTRKAPPAAYRIKDMAADTAGLLDALNIDTTHVVGMSMGGMIAQALAIRHGEKVSSLTSIMSKPGDPRTGGVDRKLLVSLARRPPVTRETAVDASVALFARIGGSSWDEATHREQSERSVERSFRPRGQLRQTAAIAASRDRTAGLGQLGQPTLVVHGLQDRLVKPSGGIATAKAVRGSRLLMFPDMGHDLPANRWGEIVDAIITNTDRAGQ